MSSCRSVNDVLARHERSAKDWSCLRATAARRIATALRHSGSRPKDQRVAHDRVTAVLDWQSQRGDFEPDGSLRDIYIQATTIEDWKVVIAFILDGNYQARLERSGAEVPVPGELTLFDGSDRHLLCFSVAGIVVDCHFFGAEEIEFSFAPNDVTEKTLQALLAFMVDIGEATQKPAIMTPENAPHEPIFRYEPDAHQLSWNPPKARESGRSDERR